MSVSRVGEPWGGAVEQGGPGGKVRHMGEQLEQSSEAELAGC